MVPFLLKVLVTMTLVVVGSAVGGLLGFAASIGIREASKLAFPNDPSAGSAGIVVIFLLPLGVLAGGVIGFLKGLEGFLKNPLILNPSDRETEFNDG